MFVDKNNRGSQVSGYFSIHPYNSSEKQIRNKTKLIHFFYYLDIPPRTIEKLRVSLKVAVCGSIERLQS
jgi:hypothetical protein